MNVQREKRLVEPAVRRKRWHAGAFGMTLALVLGACGGDGGADDAAVSSEPAASSSTPQETTNETPDDLDALLAGLRTSLATAPAGDPLPIEAGKSIFIVSCGQSLTVCSEPVAGAEAAAAAAGWTTTVFDTQADPVKFSQGVSQGIAAQPDALLFMSIDCSLVKSQVEQALDAGIEIMTMQSIDCSDAAGGGGPSLYTDREPKIAGSATFADWQRETSGIRAAWIAATAGPDANVLQLDEPSYPIYQVITQGAAEGFAEYCPSCTVTQMEFSFLDAGAKLQEKVQQALLKDPSIDVVLAADDSTVLSGVSSAVAASDNASEIAVVGFGGDASSLELIRTGGAQQMTIATDLAWWGWAAIDSLNSRFQGAPIRESGIGVQLVDTDNVPAAEGPYQGPVDYVAAYKVLWGLA
jgi:ribose transport system substrate-binding protein